MVVHNGPDIQPLTAVALRTLHDVLGDGSMPCCHTLVPDGDGLSRSGLNPRYGNIALIGLARARDAGYEVTVDLDRLLRLSLDEVSSTGSVGDIGLTCWSVAMVGSRADCDRRLKPLLVGELDLSEPQITAMGLEWLLTGVSKLHQRFPELTWLGNIVDNCYRKVLSIYNENTGLFNELNGCKFTSKWKRNLSYFCDQVYGIYSLCAYHEAVNDRLALDRALRVAKNICALQGSEGQWPWLFDSCAGTVVSMYPVYSVHQDSMAPMALLKLTSLSGIDFTEPVMRGLAWLYGKNEMNTPMIDGELGVIWRSIRRHGAVPYSQLFRMIKLMHVSHLDKLRDLADPLMKFEIDRECRPYHLGWILYAFSGR